MGIFDKRVAFKPFEYPDVVEYKDAINHSFWLVSEWNFMADVHDFKNLNEVERNAIKNALLAISQIEVSVKAFWTKLGDRFPKPEITQVGVTFGECFVDKTEILTPNGWVDLSLVKVGDDVLQYNSNNTFNITKVLHKFDKEYSGEVFRFSKKTTESIVTPNHRIVYYDINDKFSEIAASKINCKNSNNKIPESGKLIGGKEISLSFMDKLRIAIQADGNKRYYNSKDTKNPRKGNGLGSEYEIRIKKERKIKRLDEILENIDSIVFTKKQIPSRPDMYIYTIRIDDKFDYKEFDWVNLYDKTSNWCLEFIEELAEWDGYKTKGKKDCKIKFGNTNKKVADVAQFVGVAAGYRTNLIISIDKRCETYKPMYIVSFTENRLRVTIPPLKKESINYEGMVRCITVESGNIISRYNNKTFISGNSEVRHSDAYSHLLEVLGLNDDFAMLLQNPIIQGRVDYLTKYLKGASENSNESYTLTLTLFSIFIEYVSLFSQFLVIKSFNKYKNILKDVDNVVQATQKEENLHGMFGICLIKHIQEEYPQWFNDDFYEKLYRACKKAFEAEVKIIDWMFEKGELSFLPKDLVVEFIKNRFNESLILIGGKEVFDVDRSKVEKLKWFDDEIHSDVSTDFFHKKPVTYNKFSKPITSNDLF